MCLDIFKFNCSKMSCQRETWKAIIQPMTSDGSSATVSRNSTPFTPSWKITPEQDNERVDHSWDLRKSQNRWVRLGVKQYDNKEVYVGIKVFKPETHGTVCGWYRHSETNLTLDELATVCEFLDGGNVDYGNEFDTVVSKMLLEPDEQQEVPEKN